MIVILVKEDHWTREVLNMAADLDMFNGQFLFITFFSMDRKYICTLIRILQNYRLVMLLISDSPQEAAFRIAPRPSITCHDLLETGKPQKLQNRWRHDDPGHE